MALVHCDLAAEAASSDDLAAHEALEAAAALLRRHGVAPKLQAEIEEASQVQQAESQTQCRNFCFSPHRLPVQLTASVLHEDTNISGNVGSQRRTWACRRWRRESR